jgi:AraC-like DNA-binding protein
MIIESEGELINRILPGTSIVLAFRYKGQVNDLSGDKSSSLPSSVLSGLRKSVRLINYTKDSATIIILFKETGAGAFFKEPMHEFFEQSIALDQFIKRQEISITGEQLAEAVNDHERISILEGFLRSRLYNVNTDKLISAAVDKVYAASGNIKMKELAGTLYISQDAFEKRFRKITGTTPKQFSDIIRMRSAVKSMQNQKNLTGVAFDAGFFDQPHFNKAFKLFTGQSPTDFLKAPSSW